MERRRAWAAPTPIRTPLRDFRALPLHAVFFLAYSVYAISTSYLLIVESPSLSLSLEKKGWRVNSFSLRREEGGGFCGRDR